MRFVAVDVETANADLASICQIGVATFANGSLANQWQALVNPETYFDPRNVRLHGIDEERVRTSPTLAVVAQSLSSLLAEHTIVTHGAFDRIALSRAFERYSATLPQVVWLDTTRVVRRAWPEFSQRGYGLANVAKKFGIAFRHHDALEDAKAAGELLLRACAESGRTVADWVSVASRPLGRAGGKDGEVGVAQQGNPDGPLFGETIVFTGALTLPRREAAEMAALAGCKVAENVTKQTTLLVVGDQDVARLNGETQSSKHRKAEELIASGASIRILQESDFAALIDLAKRQLPG